MTRALKRSVLLCHVNAELVPQLFRTMSRWLPEDALRIGFLLWETSRIAPVHELAMRLLDEIWVPTNYVRRIFAEHGVPVTVVGKGLETPEPDRALDRAAFGLPSNSFLFLVSFDAGSSIERKNPLAAIAAFRQAFPTEAHVRLVVKVVNFTRDHGLNRTDMSDRVAEHLAADPRIHLINEFLPRRAMLRLVELCDCYVSLHRSEGFGYGPAEAMQLGRPVIVTDHSGTTDFCTHETAWLVSSTLRPVAPGEYAFDAPGGYWAEPNIAEAGLLMRQVIADSAAAQRKANAAQHLIGTLYSEAALADCYRHRLNDLGVW